MNAVDRLKGIYGRLIRTPGIGPFVAAPVRFAKRLVNDPTRAFQNKLDLAVAASAGLRNDLDGAHRRIDQLSDEIVKLQLLLGQQTAMVDALVRTGGPLKGQSTARMVLRVEWENGASQEFESGLSSPPPGQKANGPDPFVRRS